MKNNLFSLLKINIINSFKLRTTSKKKMIFLGVFAIYLIGCLMFTFGMNLNSTFELLKTANLTIYFIPLVFGMASIFSFLFSIYSAKSGLFENKDNDLLLSLPLKKTTVLASRVLYLIVYNFVINLIIIIPGLFIYINNVPTTFVFYIAMILLIIFAPIIPTILSSLFGYIVAILVSKTNAKNAFEMIFYLAFIGIYCYLFMGSNNLLGSLISNPELLNNIIKFGFAPLYLISKAIFTNNLLYMIGFVLINLVAFVIFVKVLGNWYFKIISNINNHKTKSNYKMTKINTNSVSKALFKKEIKRYFSSAIYVFNTAIGPVILLVASIASLFYSKETLLALIGNNFNISSNVIVLIAVLFTTALTNTTCVSLSIEGNNLWILKSLPVSVKDIFISKIKVNLLVVIPTAIISLILFNISGYINSNEMLLLMLLVVLLTFVISFYGLIVNLKFPLFNAQNDQVIVKRSASCFAGIVVPALISMFLITIIGNIKINFTEVIEPSIIILVVLYVILKGILFSWGIKKFNKLG